MSPEPLSKPPPLPCGGPPGWDGAKGSASRDCGGMLIVGAALGYREVELKAFGTNRRERAKRFEENLIAIKRLWSEDEVDMVGSHFELDGATCFPKP